EIQRTPRDRGQLQFRRHGRGAAMTSRPNGTSLSNGHAGITFEGITQYFLVDHNGSQKAIEALANVSLDIPPQEFIALVGPSGCGKTTLLNIAAGAHTPQEGR